MRESRGDFNNYLRMEVKMFQEMHVRVAPRITKRFHCRAPLSPGLKLAVTLRFVATGKLQASLGYSFRIGRNTISFFVPEVCDAIVEEYKMEQFAMPSNPDERAPLDCHHLMPCPSTTGTPRTMYFIIADDAFPLREWLQKPFGMRNLTHQQRIFNYRLSRARRVVENALLLASRFRVLLTTLNVLPCNAARVTKACLVLHNVMRDRYPQMQNAELDGDVDGVVVAGSWRDVGVLQDCEQEGSTGERSSRKGQVMRQYLMHYMNNDAGSVPWQKEAIRLV
ncbi:hypothetical protein Bbelb_199650 [Branchiostoma belcheri]|nr:hypothetical protein Bbelb_199650 [Branchiostoma belcheri]